MLNKISTIIECTAKALSLSTDPLITKSSKHTYQICKLVLWKIKKKKKKGSTNKPVIAGFRIFPQKIQKQTQYLWLSIRNVDTQRKEKSGFKNF